jgi:primosomal protein N' (replication factor Y)
MSSKQTILQFVIACPLPQVFDYRAPDADGAEIIGTRWRVPFGRGQRIGLLLNITDHSDCPSHKLKTAYNCLETQALLSDNILKLIKWASTYYHHPIGLVVKTALPRLLNQGKAAILPSLAGWRVTKTGHALEIDTALKKKCP